MTTAIEMARRYAKAYDNSSRKDKGRLLDTITVATGWSRDHARHQLRQQLALIEEGVSPDAVADRRRSKPKKFSLAARRTLQFVWEQSGQPCGKYLEAAMRDCVTSLEAHGHLRPGVNGYSGEVREELFQISAATIDRYLSSEKADSTEDILLSGSGTGLRTSVPLQATKHLAEPEPGYFVAEYIDHDDDEDAAPRRRTLTLTDIRIGWVRTVSFEPDADPLAVLAEAVESIPYIVTGLLVSPELPQESIEAWAAERFVAVHPISSINHGIRMAERKRRTVDTLQSVIRCNPHVDVELANDIWDALGDRLNFFMPVKNPIGWRRTPSGVRRRVYDDPVTPIRRLLDSGILCPAQTREMEEYAASLDISELTTRIKNIKSFLDIAIHEES
ncbi:hypothetical protein DFO66_10432 [Brevibacterium sanguinis]|uniref:Uncharacterized protein n=3 Tax=Brevibacteriaceae TaxID=85019 RepID=A0A366ILL1_9MICO|nr:hypothetical protein DFO66_10432 [Brevibacterium sanguinis]RBP72083.1 hypothetical protein DFO65_10438 [Brevibacterium celere]